MKRVWSDSIYHHYFYQDRDDEGECHGNVSVSYYKNAFNSYSTTIGYILKSKKTGKQVFLCSWVSMSNTTSKHLNKLRHACPFCTMLNVPFMYDQNLQGYSETSVKRIFLKRFKQFLGKKGYMAERRHTAVCRRKWLSLYTTYELFCDEFGYKIPQSFMREIQEIKADMEAREDKCHKNAEKREQARQEKLKKLMEEYKDLPLMEMGKLLFQRVLDSKLRQSIRELLSIRFNSYVSLVWPVDDHIQTSQHVTMPMKEVQTAIKAWRHGKLKVGMHIGPWELRELSDDFAQIGCHRIPMQNILELEAAVM